MPREAGRVEGLSSFELVGRGTAHQGLTKQIPWTPSPQRTLRASMNKLFSPDATQFYLVLLLQGQTDAQLVRFTLYTWWSHLKGPSLQKIDLVVLGEISETWDALGKLHHFLHCRSKTQGKLFPDFMARLVWVHMGSLTHWTDLMFTKHRQKTIFKDTIPNTDKYLKETGLLLNKTLQ